MHKGRAKYSLPQWLANHDVLFLDQPFSVGTVRNNIDEQYDRRGQHDFLLSERWNSQVLFTNWQHRDVIVAHVLKNEREELQLQLLGGTNNKLASDLQAVIDAGHHPGRLGGRLGPVELVLDCHAYGFSETTVDNAQKWPLIMGELVMGSLQRLLKQSPSETTVLSLQLRGYSMGCECFRQLVESINECAFLKRVAIKVHLTDVGELRSSNDVGSWNDVAQNYSWFDDVVQWVVALSKPPLRYDELRISVYSLNG